MNRRRVILVVFLTVFVAMVIFQRPFSTVMTVSYPDMEAVVEDRAIARGWIPLFLPDDAHTIHERHNLDTNEGWGAFSFEDWAETNRMMHWRRVASAPFPRSPNRVTGDGTIDWWPPDLEDGFVYFQGVDDHRFWLAVDFERKVGYFWQDG